MSATRSPPPTRDCLPASRAVCFRAGRDADAAACPRCGARLHLRKPASLLRSWTFLVAAIVLYVPANVLPIMQTNRSSTRRATRS